MKRLNFIISCLMVVILASCTGSTGSGGSNNATGSDSISWSAPTTRIDGTAMSSNEISAYRVSYGMDPSNLDHVEDVSSTTHSKSLTSLTPGTWYFWVQTIDSQGRPGPPSAINSVTIR